LTLVVYKGRIPGRNEAKRTPIMAKTVTNRGLSKLRDSLLVNCIEAQSLLAAVESQASVSGLAKKFITEVSETASGLTTSTASIGSVDISKILIYVQGSMVNEWLTFLDSVFRDVVLYLLKTKSATLPNVTIDLTNVRTTGVGEMRESLADAAREAFSFNTGYKSKVSMLEALFTVTRDDELFEQMYKHVVIRNLWQHNEGKIRSRDLAKMGRDGQFISIRKDAAGADRYRVDQKVFLTKAELEHLFDIIVRYSGKFEALP